MEQLDRDQLAAQYFDLLEFEPYPVQEEALLAWFTTETGVLVCAPTGTGKTLIAEAAMFEALQTGATAYYTTPLIALTEQKYEDLRRTAEAWGFSPDDVGLVTGNRRVNPDARILVVVAEILLNRLLHPDGFDFANVSAVVMDEFHSFNDPERGIVWELSLGLLPAKTRLLLLSATVGNSREFVQWLSRCHDRRIELVEGTERRVPLTYQWVGDRLLSEQLESMATGDDDALTPALVFCFNRDACWTVAEQFKGKKLVGPQQQKLLATALAEHDWSQGAGPKLKQILQRGVGVHHAGVLPKYRRIVEDLFQQRLLTVVVCTETLAAGINLPARSVVLPSLIKGPPGKKKLLEASSAHQMFGRAGRPQFDSQGYVFAMAHEDDVKLLRWRQKYDQIPEDTKDPGLRKQKKSLKKKMPKRRATEQYWSEAQFEQIRTASSANLSSRGPLPWRLLAHMLEASPEVDRVRTLISKRLLAPKQLEQGQRALDRMLLTLWRAGYVTLEPSPLTFRGSDAAAETGGGSDAGSGGDAASANDSAGANDAAGADLTDYRAELAHPTDELPKLSLLRSVHPLYGVFVINQLGIADHNERLQAMESVLEMPGSVARFVRVPNADEMPAGPLATTRLDVQLLQLGLASAEELGAAPEEEEDEDRWRHEGEERVWPLKLGEKLRRLFDHDFPGVQDFRTTAVWAAGELLEFGGDFQKYVTSKQLQKQEGVIFRHLLRLILLCGEFSQVVPPDLEPQVWLADLREIAERLTAACRSVDPLSTDKALEQAGDQNLLDDPGEAAAG